MYEIKYLQIAAAIFLFLSVFKEEARI